MSWPCASKFKDRKHQSFILKWSTLCIRVPILPTVKQPSTDESGLRKKAVKIKSSDVPHTLPISIDSIMSWTYRFVVLAKRVLDKRGSSSLAKHI